MLISPELEVSRKHVLLLLTYSKLVKWNFTVTWAVNHILSILLAMGTLCLLLNVRQPIILFSPWYNIWVFEVPSLGPVDYLGSKSIFEKYLDVYIIDRS